MSLFQRPLQGLVVGLSISESDDSAQRGFPSWQVNRVTLQVVSALFGQGAGVVFGHDWREDGVMEAVHGFARQMQPPDSLSPDEAKAAGQPLLENLLPWPDTPELSRKDRERLASTLHVEEAGLPFELVPVSVAARRAGPNSAFFRYVRARGLTHLRHRLLDRTLVRLCLGGKRGGSQGRYPGIVEEALLNIENGQPLFLTGLLGGATRQVIDAIEGESLPEAFCPPTTLNEIYRNPPPDVVELDPITQSDRQINPRQVWSTFQKAGLKGISQRNHLNDDENAELFHTPVLDRAIQLVLTGLSRIREEGR